MKRLISIFLIILSFVNGQTVSLDPIPTTSYCSGDGYAISFQVSGGAFNSGNIFTLELSDNSGNFSSPTSLGTLNIIGSGTYNGTWGALPYGTGYRVRVTASDPNFNSVPSIASLTLSPILSVNTIGSQQSVCAGNTITLTGSLPSGGSGNYIYQWESSSDDVSWSNISGQTNQNMNSITPSVTSYFRRRVESFNSVCAAIFSISARVDVLPVIGNNTILSDQTLCAGITIDAITGSIPTGGAGSYSYEWQSSVNFSAWQTIAGFTAQGFNYNAGLSSNTYFRRVITDGICANTSSSVSIFVIPGIGNNVIGNNQTLCSGSSSATITGSLPTGGNGSPIYQWQSSNDNSGWSNISGASLISYAPGLLPSTTYFRRQVTAGLCNAFSSSVSVLMVPVLSNNIIGSAQTICSNTSPVAFTGSIPAGGNDQFLYQWETSINNTNWNPLVGSTNQGLTFGQLMTSSLYFRRVVNNLYCTSINSASLGLLVLPSVGNNTITANQTICQGSSIGVSGSIPSGGSGTYVYQWFSSTNNNTWFNIPDGTGISLNTGPLSITTYYYRSIISGPCLNNSVSVRITVNTPISANTVGVSQTVCANQSFTALTGNTPTGGSGVYSYQWFSSSNDNLWQTITGATQSGLSSIALSATHYFRRVITSLPCPALTSTSVRITVNPVPSSTVTQSGPLNFCLFDSLIMTAPPGLSYLWSTGAVAQSIRILNTGTYSVQIINSFNCTVTSSLFPVLVYSLPTPVISGSNTVCSNQAEVLSAGNFVSYLWSTGHTTSSITVNGSGTYSVRVIDANNCVGRSSNHLLTVYSAPVAGIQYSGSSVICEGSVLVLSGTTGLTHRWNTGSLTDTIQVYSSGYYVDTVETTQGCRAWSGVSVLVNPNPRPAVVYNGSAEFCSGDSLLLQLGSIYASYQWSTGATTPTIRVGNSGSYAVRVSDIRGCIGYSDTVLTTVKALPIVTITPGGIRSICSGDLINVQAFGASSYQWSTGNTGSLISIGNPGVYFVDGYLNGCTSRSPLLTVSVISPPEPNFVSSGSLRFCEGDSVILTAISSGPYLWNTGSVQSSISVKNSGSYTLTSLINGCSRTSQPIQVIVDTLPSIQIVHVDTLFCPGDTLHLLGNTGLQLYQWSSGFMGKDYVVTQPGDYTLTGTDFNGCRALSDTISIGFFPVVNPQIVLAGDSILCPGDSASLTFSHGINPIWNTGDTLNQLWVNSSGYYSVMVQDSFGCMVSSHPFSISTIQMPKDRIILNGPLQICQGDSVVLNSSVATGRFNWSNGDTTSSTTVTQTGTYILEYFDGTEKCAVLDSVFIDVKNIPQVVIESSSADIACRGDKMVLSTSSDYDSYLWNTGDTTRSISIQTSGIYQVNVSSFGCESQGVLSLMLGYQAPKEALVLKADDILTGILICREEGKQYLWGYEYKENPNGQEFFVCDGDCRPWMKYDYLDTAQFYYWAYVGDRNCLQKWYWNGHSGLRTGFFESNTAEWTVYPNPFSTTMFVSIPDNYTPLQVELINSMGKVVRYFPVDSFEDGGKLRLELSDITAGVYWLSIRHESGKEVIEVLRQ